MARGVNAGALFSGQRMPGIGGKMEGGALRARSTLHQALLPQKRSLAGNSIGEAALHAGLMRTILSTDGETLLKDLRSHLRPDTPATVLILVVKRDGLHTTNEVPLSELAEIGIGLDLLVTFRGRQRTRFVRKLESPVHGQTAM